MHLDDERFERLRHGELSVEAERASREHLAGCPACRSLLLEAEEEESEVYARLRVVDHPLPPRSWNEVVSRARGGGSAFVRRAAAVLLLLGGAGVAYAAPGSPVPGWVRAAMTLVTARRGPAPAPLPQPAPQPAGIAVDPGSSLLISFRSRQQRGGVRVTLGEGAEVELRAPAGAARFATRQDQLLVENAGSTADFDLLIPRGAPRVEIRVAGERMFLKQGSRISVDGAGAGRVPLTLPLTPPGP